MEAVKAQRMLQFIVVLSFAGLVLVYWDATRDKVIRVGDQAPDFRITTANKVTLSRSSFGGKILVLNFWATWCPPCVREMPLLERLHREYSDRGLVIFGISVDKNENKYRDFVRRFGLTFPTAHDSERRINALYGTWRYPETYIINREGRVISKVVGELKESDAEFIRSLL
jgi:peroxiredoxin